jgi:hypothetical protein
MDELLILAGVLLLVFAVVDLLWTTLWVDGGAGPLSSRIMQGLWRGLRAVSGSRSRALSLAGPLVLVASLSAWVLLLWVGWTLVFAGGEDALVVTGDPRPVTWTGHLWFVAYTLATVGNGDFSPNGGVWQVAASLTAFTGFTFITLAVTYVLSVLGAVASKRSFASGVTGRGMTGAAFARSGWSGGDFRALDLPLNTLAAQLDRLADQHAAYPILRYYHSRRVETASAVAVAVLDEALTVLRFGVPKEARPNGAVVEGARSSVQSYLRTLDAAFIEPADHVPPPPDLGRLRAAGISTASGEAFAEALADLKERRRKLLGMVEADAWAWPAGEQVPSS